VALKRLDVTTAYPFLLDLMDDLACQKCSEDDFITSCAVNESFIGRPALNGYE
jgi:hypothetical protein